MAAMMAAPYGKPVKTSRAGRLNKPIYARTSVLCNGQIVWKVGSAQDMEYVKTDVNKAELGSPVDVKDDLIALNGLQMYRTKPLTPLEVKQPLRHVQSSLPREVKARIYTGDLYGSAHGVFSCPDDQFETKARRVFKNEVRGDREINYNEFFRRLRRAEWLLWDVEAEKGHWVAVIAHLHKSTIRNPDKKKGLWDWDDDAVPASITSPEFNRIDEWCVVTAHGSSEGNVMVDRVKNRLPTILKHGKIGIDRNSEIQPAIWIPTDETNWSSGLRIYALIKTLMHRITEFHCTQQHRQPTIWHPVSGWLNVDEVRAEMQGRAAQRCMAATGYRSRIAIEGVRRWIGMKQVVRAKELRPRHRDNQAYFTGKVGRDGRCIPVGPYGPDSDNSNGGPDDDNGKGPDGRYEGEQDLPPQEGEEDPVDEPFAEDEPLNEPFDGDEPFDEVYDEDEPFNEPFDDGLIETDPFDTDPFDQNLFDEFDDDLPEPTPSDTKPSHNQSESNAANFGGSFKIVTPVNIPRIGSQGQTLGKNNSSYTYDKFSKPRFSGPLDSPPSHVHGWDGDSDDSISLGHRPLNWPKRTSTNQVTSETRNMFDNNDFEGPPKPVHPVTEEEEDSPFDPKNPRFSGPLDSPPSHVHGWNDDSSDISSLMHTNLTVQAEFEEYKKRLMEQANASQARNAKRMAAGLPVPPSKASSAKATDSKATEGKNQRSQAGRDRKGKRKQVGEHERRNSKRKTQETAVAKGDGDAASKEHSPEPGLDALIDMFW